MRRAIFVWLAVLLAAALPAALLATTIEASADRLEVPVGEAFTYTISVQSDQGQVPNPEPPEFKGFMAKGAGTSTSLNMTNGNFQVTLQSSYQLVPQQEGTLTIGPARVRTAAGVVESNPVTIKVLPAAAAPPPLPANPPGAQPGEEPPAQPSQGGVDPGKLFLHADVNRREVYVGEPLGYFSALLSEYDLAECSIQSEAQFTGFVVENIEVKRQLHAMGFRGKTYPLGCEVSRKVLIPAAPGTFAIQPEVLVAGVKVPSQQRRGGRRGGWPFDDPFGRDDPFDDPLFDRFFGRGYQVRKQQVTAEPIQVKVLPLPEQGKPKNFSGIIADGLSISAGLDKRIDQKTVKTGVRETDAINLKVVFNGRGDIRGIPKPQLQLGDQFKEYESKATPELKIDEKGISGRKTFEFVLVPKRTGDLTIPPVEVTYFDSAARTYKTIRTEPIRMEVAPGEKEERAASTGAPSEKKDVAVLGRDLRFISESPSALEDHGGPLHRAGWFRAVNLAPLALLVAVALAARRRRALERDPVRARRLAAQRTATERLRAAKVNAASSPEKTIYAQAEDALLGYLADKLAVPAGSIVIETADALLGEKGVPSDLAARARALLTRFEQARFAPSAGGAAGVERDLEAVEGLVADLERVL